ncbi:MAG: hypothetical protein EBX50_07935 [Chitinophagia bacterium]|nr:hypothetical protein [Chitinophagia bacterium]
MIDPAPLLDSKLSLRAKGIWGLYMAAGKALSAAEIYPLVPEGRDAVRKAVRELISAGYVSEVSFRTQNGQWAYQLQVTQAWITGDGFSGTLLYGTASSYSTSSFNTLEELTNVSSPNVSGEPEEEEEFVEMPWPEFDEPSTKSDDEVGVVGKLADPVDKKELRKQKYKKSSFAAVPESMLRNERPETEWTTQDLVAEFYDLTREHAKGAPSQVNGKSLSAWINQQVGQGVPRIAILRALRAFFNDPRLVRDPGIGKPFWRRFIAYYPTVHGRFANVEDIDYSDERFSAHQAKMLKLLEGNV